MLSNNIVRMINFAVHRKELKFQTGHVVQSLKDDGIDHYDFSIYARLQTLKGESIIICLSDLSFLLAFSLAVLISLSAYDTAFAEYNFITEIGMYLSLRIVLLLKKERRLVSTFGRLSILICLLTRRESISKLSSRCS